MLHFRLPKNAPLKVERRTIELVTAPFPQRVPPGPVTVSRISDEWATPLFATLAAVGFGMMSESPILDAVFDDAYNAVGNALKGIAFPVTVAVLYAQLLACAEQADEENPFHMAGVRTLAGLRSL